MDKQVAKMMKEMISTDDFCKVKNNKLSDVGLTKGMIVYIAGTQVVPENKKDPYTQRIKFIITPLVEGHIQPNGKMYLIDPRNIKKVHQRDQDMYQSNMKEDYDKEGSSADDKEEKDIESSQGVLKEGGDQEGSVEFEGEKEEVSGTD